MPKQNDAVDQRFWPRDLTSEQTRQCDELRRQYEATANMVVTMTPRSREQSLALTQLEQSAFWAIAAIARH